MLNNSSSSEWNRKKTVAFNRRFVWIWLDGSQTFQIEFTTWQHRSALVFYCKQDKAKLSFSSLGIHLLSDTFYFKYKMCFLHSDSFILKDDYWQDCTIQSDNDVIRTKLSAACVWMSYTAGSNQGLLGVA